MLRHAYADQRERLDVAVAFSARLPPGTIAHARVALERSSSLPLICCLGESHTRSPSVVPDTDDFEHVSPLQLKLIVSSGLVRPKHGNGIIWMYVILGVIIFEELQLLRLARGDAIGT